MSPWRLALLGVFVSLATASAQDVDPVRLDALIRDMGSDGYAKRAKAMRELSDLGGPALDALKQASKSRDLETARRAAELVTRIEERLLVEQILAPKKLRLKVDNVSVQDAVKELSRLSGYAVEIDDFADRKITLDTGETTFFEALDRLCKVGGLTFAPPVAPTPAPGFPPPPRPVPLPVPRLPGPPQALPGKAVFPKALAADPPAPPPPAKAQVQVQQVQIQFAPPLGTGVPVALPAKTGPIRLRRGTSDALVSHSGAVRLQLTPAVTGGIGNKSERWYQIEAQVEPRLETFNPTGAISLEKARDDQGQDLSLILPETAAMLPALPGGINGFNPYLPQQPATRTVQLRLKTGEKAAKKIAELAGTLTAHVTLTNEVLASVDNIKNALGQKVDTKDGGSLQVNTLQKMAGGNYRLQVTLDNAGGGNPFGGNLMIQGNIIVGAGGGVNVWNPVNPATLGAGLLPDLLDARGQKLKMVGVPAKSTRIANGQMSRTLTIDYQPHEGQEEPSRVVLFGFRTVTVPVPFRFENVPLP